MDTPVVEPAAPIAEPAARAASGDRAEAAVADPPSRPAAGAVSSRVDVAEWCFRLAMVALLVLFLAAIAFRR